MYYFKFSITTDIIDDLNAKQKSITTLNFLVNGQISFTDISEANLDKNKYAKQKR
jgi:hypothetical protein